MTVAVVWVEGDVGDDGEFWEGEFEGTDGGGDEAVWVEGFFCARGFECVVDAGEEDDGADAVCEGGGGFGDEAIEGPAVAAGHGGDGFVGLGTAEEERVDELFRVESGFPDEAAEGRGLAVASGADGKVHVVQGTNVVVRASRVLGLEVVPCDFVGKNGLRGVDGCTRGTLPFRRETT